MKKKILFVYPSMLIGGSTTSMLAFMNCLDPEKYSIDLQLYKNEGPLLNVLPEYVNLLPEAQKYTGATARINKLIKFIIKGYFLKAFFRKLKFGKIGLSQEVLGYCKAKEFSKKNSNHYDYAIGYLEGWSDKYLAWGVNADRKYAWLHSTFANITGDPDIERPWMKLMDKIVFVADACRDAFNQAMPDMASKTLTIENITDSSLIRKRSEQVDFSDEAYARFVFYQGQKIVTVCRLDVNTKGLDRIVECAKRMKSENRKFLWYIIGDGEGKELLEQTIQQADVADVLVPVGKRMNPYPFIKASDVMCMLSRYEGKPMIVTECMILGVPCVVTEYLSSRDQIEDKKEGYIVPNEDSVVVDAATSCINNYDCLMQMHNYLSNNEYGNSDYISVIEEKLFSL